MIYWTDNKTNPPRENEEVLICHQLGYIHIAIRKSNEFILKNTAPLFKVEENVFESQYVSSFPSDVIKYWMPLPIPPKDIKF